ncbi:exported protein, unknown function [Hepatocystis sp. ex Piliocolobus tephrosceles]|nr:exported protein, unknown function [Hepatocystis sp. ex Piliocolobus tephrosceles]
MFKTIYKLIIVPFVIWIWNNNSKVRLHNMLNTKHGRSMAQHSISLNNEDNHSYVINDKNINKFYKHYKQHMFSKNVPNDEYNKKKFTYVTDIKKELIKILDNRKEPQITNILKNNENIQQKDLLAIYDLFKHVISIDEYLQLIYESCELLKIRHKGNNEFSETHFNSILYLLNTYFFLATNKNNLYNHEQIFKKNKFKFKAKHFNIFKLNHIIDKKFKNMLLKKMVKDQIRTNVHMSLKFYFMLYSYTYFYPLLLLIILISTIPCESVTLPFILLGLFIPTYTHSTFKFFKNIKSLKHVLQYDKWQNDYE